MRIGTIVARNYLALARVLAASLHDLDDRLELSVLVLDDEDQELDDTDELFEILRPSDLDIEHREFRHMATIYDILELATSLKPWLLQRLLESDDVVAYLDPDIEVFGSLSDVEELARRHSIVLTPHTTRPMPRDGLLPSEQTIRLAGVFNLGFIAASRDADAFLVWWTERLRRECRLAVDEGLFVDQRWIDFVPCYFDHTVLIDEGYNVAYWNLYYRDVKFASDGYEVNGRPLRFFHYSGFDPLRPYLLSKHQGGEPRVKLEDHFAVAHLCERYAAKLLAAGHLEMAPSPYRFGFTADGVRIDSRMRRIYAEALEAIEDEGASTTLPDPFDPADTDAFTTWLQTPATETVKKPKMGRPPTEKSPLKVSRYLGQVYKERRDIAAHFSDLLSSGKLTNSREDEYLDWMREHGRGIAGVPPEFMPPPAVPSGPRPKDLPEGVNLVGYLRAEDGLGEAARGTLDVLRLLNSPLSLRTCTVTASRQMSDFDDTGSDLRTTYDVTIASVNADQLPLVGYRLGPRMPRAEATIGSWMWEVETFPEWMARSAALVDEIWVCSQHAADAVAKTVDVPVHVLQIPVVVPDALEVDRAAAGLTDDFTFLFCFDFGSVFQRKNPVAVIEAFRRAFPPGAGPRLVIKSVNGAAVPMRLAQLRAAAEGRSDIVIRDGYESAEDQRHLMAAADCYVSLHRAEGFGLTLAEAMAVGKPVIGTGYSGNLEFMTPENSVLVPYEMERIPFGSGPYPPSASWAAPDIDAAAEAMRKMASDPVAAAQLGARARAHMKRHHTAAARVAFVRARLDALRSSR